VKVAVPLPVPVAPAVKVTKVALLVAVHVHPVPAVTVMVAEPVPPSGPYVVVGWTTLKAQVGPVLVVELELFLHAVADVATIRPRITARENWRSTIMRSPSSAVENT